MDKYLIEIILRMMINCKWVGIFVFLIKKSETIHNPPILHLESCRGYFDGASQMGNNYEGVGDVIWLNDEKKLYKIKLNCGSGINSKSN